MSVLHIPEGPRFEEIALLKSELRGLNRAEVLNGIIRNLTEVGREALLGGGIYFPAALSLRGVITDVKPSMMPGLDGEELPILLVQFAKGVQRESLGVWENLYIEQSFGEIPNVVIGMAFAEDIDVIRTTGPLGGGNPAYLRIPS